MSRYLATTKSKTQNNETLPTFDELAGGESNLGYSMRLFVRVSLRRL